jgi:hypothetical protein
MIHLIPSVSEQTIKVLPRNYSTGVVMSLRDDSTNETALITPTVVLNGNYLDVTAIFNLVEGRYYDLKIFLGVGYDDLDIIYRDKIFATTQTINQETNNYYTPNKDSFISESGDNDFIFI